ncbi:MAG: hypothetical protein JFR24_03280 [Muribaculaceae bacterium]|jgi:hypothetical protein|nr:hypothetical protein [Muribaculaceae bacterium]
MWLLGGKHYTNLRTKIPHFRQLPKKKRIAPHLQAKTAKPENKKRKKLAQSKIKP